MCYLDGNSLGRLPKATVAAINDFMTKEWGPEVVTGWSHWVDEAQPTGDLLGEAALGAAAGQVLDSRYQSIHDITDMNGMKMGMISELMISITSTLLSPPGNRIEEISDASAPRSFVKTYLKTKSIFRGR
jgi:hypothetical protein